MLHSENHSKKLLLFKFFSQKSDTKFTLTTMKNVQIIEMISSSIQFGLNKQDKPTIYIENKAIVAIISPMWIVLILTS